MIEYIFLPVAIAMGYYFCKIIPRPERNKIFYIFLTAFILRVAVAFILYNIAVNTGKAGFFTGFDDYASGNVSLEIAKWWREVGFSFPDNFPVHITEFNKLLFHSRMTYELLTAFILFISNSNILLVLFTNCFFGASSAIILYMISRCFFDEKASLISAGIFTLWPSLVFWSAINLREALVSLLFLSVILAGIKLFREIFTLKSVLTLAILSMLLFALYTLLKPFFYFLSFFLIIGIIVAMIKKIRSGARFIVMISALLLFMFLATGPFIFSKTNTMKKINDFFTYELGYLGSFMSDPVNAVEQARQTKIVYAEGTKEVEKGIFLRGKSVILPDWHITSYRDLGAFLSVSLFIGLFYPLPWQAQSLMAQAAVPEMLLWYALFPFFLRGIFVSFKLLRKYPAGLSFVILLMGSLFLVLPMYDGNAGALFRHRGVIMPITFIFIAVGLTGVTSLLFGKNRKRCPYGNSSEGGAFKAA